MNEHTMEMFEGMVFSEKPEESENGKQEQLQPRLKEINRNQLLIRPVDVEKLVEEDHPVRAIWEFVGRMDLTEYYKQIGSFEGEAGRSAIDPRLLISLWVYAYSDGVSSGREVSRLCEYHPGYQWLTGMEPINHHTLSDFRVGHKELLDQLFGQALGILSSEGLITLERVMHDGTKVKACAGVDTFRGEQSLEAHLEMARKQVEEMGDPREENLSARVRRARQRAVREKKERLEMALEQLNKVREGKSRKADKEKARVSQTDPEARIMKQSDGGYAPSYNVQISTDAKEGIIVSAGVTQSANDQGQLDPALEQIEENFGRIPEQVVVDAGYVNRETIINMKEKGVDFIGNLKEENYQAENLFKRRGVQEGFFPEDFCYDSPDNSYTCPAGKILRFSTTIESNGGLLRHIYKASTNDCNSCPLKQKCCPQSLSGRCISRSEEPAAVTEFLSKMQTLEAKAIYKQRGHIAEFPNSWIKQKIGLRQFRVRGLTKVAMEAVWACLTYNIQQWLRLKWKPCLAAA